MLTKDEARALVVAEIQRPSKYPYPDALDPKDFVVVDESTIEKDWGWVFFYQSARYFRTGDPGDLLAGNGPYLVNRYTGEIVSTGPARPIEHYITEYERRLSSR